MHVVVLVVVAFFQFAVKAVSLFGLITLMFLSPSSFPSSIVMPQLQLISCLPTNHYKLGHFLVYYHGKNWGNEEI